MVLLVDDEPDIRDLARLILEIDGLAVVEAASGAEALAQYFELSPPPVPAAVVLDQRMPGLSGLEVAEQMLSHHPDQVIVLFSAYLDQAAQAEAKALGVSVCLSKLEARRLPEIIRCLLVPRGLRSCGAPGRTRTCDRRIRRPLLYPAELRGRGIGMTLGTCLVDQLWLVPVVARSDGQYAAPKRHAASGPGRPDRHRCGPEGSSRPSLGARVRGP